MRARGMWSGKEAGWTASRVWAVPGTPSRLGPSAAGGRGSSGPSAGVVAVAAVARGRVGWRMELGQAGPPGHHLVDDAVGLRLLRGEDEVPLGVARDPIQGLARVPRQDL